VYLFKYLIKYKPKDNQQRTKDTFITNDNKERLVKDRRRKTLQTKNQQELQTKETTDKERQHEDKQIF